MNEKSDTLTIKSLGAQGDGIAHAMNGSVFVPNALPGETWTRDGENEFVLASAPSADRQEPVCPHFSECGGCVAQHMAPDLYRSWKHQAVVEALNRVGLQATVLALREGHRAARRRAALMLHRGDTGRVTVGFHQRQSHTVFDLETCPVLHPAILSAVPHLKSQGHLLLPTNSTARATLTIADGGLMVKIDGENIAAIDRSQQRAKLMDCAARMSAVKLSINGDLITAIAPATLRFGRAEVAIPEGSFLQAVAQAEEAMLQRVRDGVGKAKRVADLFCGVGTWTFPLAEKVTVAAYDSDGSAIDALAAASRQTQHLKPIEATRRDLFRNPVTAGELKGHDAAVINPPRAGAKAQVSELAQSSVPKIVMVSCNPTTFARDARILTDSGYMLGDVTPIDQFLWSPHIELVATFSRPKAAGPRKSARFRSQGR